MCQQGGAAKLRSVATKKDLVEWTLEILRDKGGSAHHVDIAKEIWLRHEDELRLSRDLFFTWQYDLRWAGKTLRDRGLVQPVTGAGRGDGVWRLAR